MKQAEVEAMSGAELVAAYNGLRPETPVKPFASHAAGVKRVVAALGEQPTETPAAKPSPKSKRAVVEPAAAPAPESVVEAVEEPLPAVAQANAAPAPAVAPPAVEKPARESRITAYAATPGGKEPKPGSKRGQMLAALRADGITINEMRARFEWKLVDCRDALRLLGKQNGVGTTLSEDGRWRVA